MQRKGEAMSYEWKHDPCNYCGKDHYEWDCPDLDHPSEIPREIGLLMDIERLWKQETAMEWLRKTEPEVWIPRKEEEVD
jgi:hypothetical protein